MRILFLTDNFPPETNAPATRTFEHCTEWVKQGKDVTVITCFPNFPTGKIYAGYKNKLYQKEEINGIKVIRVWSYMRPNKGFLTRILDYASFGVMAIFASLFVKTDIIIATSPQFFTAVGGYFAALFKRRPWIMEVRDLWPESIQAVGALKEGKILTFLERIELFLYEKSTKIIVNSSAFKKNMVARGISASKITTIENGVDLHKFKPKEKNKVLLQSIGLTNKFVVGYIGTHGMAHQLDFILKAARNVNGNTHFLFIGNGAKREKLLALKEELDLKNVTMLDSVSKEEVPDYLSLLDLGLVNLKKSDTFKTVIPSKIFENAAMQKPILLGVEGIAKKIVQQFDAGLAFEPENEIDFIAQLNRFQSNKQLLQTKKVGCQLLAKHFDRKRLAVAMLSEIELILQPGWQKDRKKNLSLDPK